MTLSRSNRTGPGTFAIQGTTIYISFGVLVVVIYLLINIYPSLGQADLGNLFAGSGGSLPASGSASSSSTTAAPMAYMTLKQTVPGPHHITGLGSGLIIGLFTQGKIKFGLVHGLGMMLAGMVFLIIMMG